MASEGMALQWIMQCPYFGKSAPREHRSTVACPNPVKLHFGVPQGFHLGTNTFSPCSRRQLGDIICKHGLGHNIYADGNRHVTQRLTLTMHVLRCYHPVWQPSAAENQFLDAFSNVFEAQWGQKPKLLIFFQKGIFSGMRRWPSGGKRDSGRSSRRGNLGVNIWPAHDYEGTHQLSLQRSQWATYVISVSKQAIFNQETFHPLLI